MKTLLALVLSISVCWSMTSWPVASEAQHVECHFLCKRLPKRNELSQHFGKPTTDYLPQRPLDVLVWNVYKGRKDHFFKIFRALAKTSDLILLSEATDGDLVKPVLVEKTGYKWEMSVNFFMKYDVATGLVSGTYAQPTFVAVEQTKDLEPFVRSPKTLLVTRYNVRNIRGALMGQVLIVNIHGINWAGNDAFARHLKLAEPYIRGHVGPVLFAGDFNTKNRTRYEMLTQFARKYGMKRAPWKNPSDDDQLDDAFLRGFEVHEAHLINQVAPGGSDHPALFLRLSPRWN